LSVVSEPYRRRSICLNYFFGNRQTRHFLQWIMESGHVDPHALVASALDQADPDEEPDPDEELEPGDVSGAAREHLAQELASLLSRLAHEAVPKGPNGENSRDDCGTFRCQQRGYSWDGALFAPLLVDAIAEINLYLVAEALLVLTGTYVPGRERPEVATPPEMDTTD
jgi:hypothetical protein